MVSKEYAAEYLTRRGYPADVIDGVVQVRNPVNAKQKAATLKIFSEIGYDASYEIHAIDPEPSWYEKLIAEQREAKRAAKKKTALDESDQLPGQMSIFDYA